jgi:hypothetical protein
MKRSARLAAKISSGNESHANRVAGVLGESLIVAVDGVGAATYTMRTNLVGRRVVVVLSLL